MKLPIDQRLDGEPTPDLLEAVLAATTPDARPSRLGSAVRAALARLRLALAGPGRCDIPDNLRDDAGLLPRDEPRRPEPWDKPPLW